jgi:hypothetical protein
MDFQPITTVPRDGTAVVLRDLDGRSICAVIQGNNVTLQRTELVPKLFQKDGSLGNWLKWKPAERA